MTEISASEVRSNFSDILSRVAYGKERVTVARRGRPVASLLPIEDLAQIEVGEILSAVADRIPGIVYQRIQHPDGREEYTYLSPGFRDTFGIEPAEMFADPTILSRAIHPEDWELRDRAIAESARTVSNYDVQYRAITPAGEIRWLHARAQPERRADGAIVWTGITLDVTNWKETEARLHESEARLRESEARNRSRFDAIPISVWEEDWSEVKKMIDRLAAGGVTDWQSYFESHGEEVIRAFELCKTLNINRATLEMYRAPNQENAIDVILSPPMTEAESRKFTDWIVSFANCNYIFIAESEEPRVDGSTFHARVRSHIPPDHADTWDRVITTVEDITESKRTERALRESEEQLRLVTDNLPALIAYVDADQRYRFVNRTAETWYGIPRAEVIGKRLDEIFDRAGFEDFLPRVERALAGERIDFDARVVYPDGTTRDVAESFVPDITEDGTVQGYFAVVTDITERKMAEETIRTRDAWLRTILDNAPIQIVLKDTEGRIMALSRNTGDRLGTSMDDFIGRTAADFLPEDVAEIYMATDREVVATGRPIQQEVVEDWDGTTRHYLSSKFPLRDDDGQTIGVCSLTSDITKEKRAEARLRQAQKMEAVGQLTGGVAHDFNNLLAVILGNAELLAERLGAENRLDAVDRQIAAVVRAARGGAELTQRLLAFSRRQPLEPIAIDLASQVAGMTELLTHTLGATIEISVASMPKLWRASADPGQLENALLNLALNARDAMAEGGRLSISSANVNLNAGKIADLSAGQDSEEIMLEPGQMGGPGDYVMLSVSDTGTGMSAAVLTQVFEPFFTTKGVGQGSGLGLSMVYGFARQSGGFTEIESVPGRGTTVRLYLPRASAPAPVVREQVSQVERGHGETVLLLEDAQDVRELAIDLLEDLGYKVLAAADAAEAGALLAENPGFDLLLTDVLLPGGRSGPEFAATARRHHPALKVLLMSGYPAESLAGHAGDLIRDTPLLRKPFEKSILAKAVRSALDDGGRLGATE